MYLQVCNNVQLKPAVVLPKPDAERDYASSQNKINDESRMNKRPRVTTSPRSLPTGCSFLKKGQKGSPLPIFWYFIYMEKNTVFTVYKALKAQGKRRNKH